MRTERYVVFYFLNPQSASSVCKSMMCLAQVTRLSLIMKTKTPTVLDLAAEQRQDRVCLDSDN